ncbi:hypothetical protein K438DRAFT_1984138 [Mycena galopus ATCC 62051]|nr:hypothetical protein K438DRAFT_1984138 [Mycena galopus ATCC 62051]
MSNRNRVSNLEISLMLSNLKDPNSTTRSCTQCTREVPKTQVLLTCDKCREKKKRQKERKKERDEAIAVGRGASGNGAFSSAPLQAVVARQEQETAARRAATRGSTSKAKADSDSGASAAVATSSSSSSSIGMGLVMQAILDEHERETKPKPKKKATTKKAALADEGVLGGLDLFTSLLLFEMATAGARGGSSSKASGSGSKTAKTGTKRKLQEISEPNEPGTIYDPETAKKRMRGDMPMPRLEPISQANTAAKQKVTKPLPEPAASSSAPTAKPLPLTTQSSNLPPPTKTDPGAKASQKVQANISSFFKPSAKSV